MVADAERGAIRAAYERRNPDLDPQLVWRGKDVGDPAPLEVMAAPLYIQEKIKPQVLIDDLRRRSGQRRGAGGGGARQGSFTDVFADFNGLPDGAERTDFYQHQANWSNRMILGDSLQAMASLAERESLRGQVQCIYLDPPYGIKFNSNFQWSTTSRDVRDGKREHVTREPEQVKAFRDTWRDGIHSYLSYLRDRLTVARDLLTESGSIFVQIGDENVHRVRAVMDEVFGDENFVSLITIRKTTSEGGSFLGATTDFILWYGKSVSQTKFRAIYSPRSDNAESRYSKIGLDSRAYRLDNITSSRPAGEGDVTSFVWNGRKFDPGNGTFKTTEDGLRRLDIADRLYASARGKLNYRRFQDDFSIAITNNLWGDISGAVQSRSDPKIYVVQTSTQAIERCILMTTDPGDLVLDPTCGAGTTAYVAEQWGRRWITIDTSRVALALARMRLMGARYPWYLLADSAAGQQQLAAVERREPSTAPTHDDVRQGFVYRRVPHVTLRAIANNAEIDVIWEQRQPPVERALCELNRALRGHGTPFEVASGGRAGRRIDFTAHGEASEALPSGESAPAAGLLEWEVPRQPPSDWTAAAREPLARFWEARQARQREIDASIAARADYEYLYDQPYDDRGVVRVAGPFTVESLSPHRILGVDEHGELIDAFAETPGHYGEPQDFGSIILDNLRRAGVQQAHKEGKIDFTSLEPRPGRWVCAVGAFESGPWTGDAGSGGGSRRAGIFIGPEFGTVARVDLVEAAHEAAEAKLDLLIACAFNYEAHTTELDTLGRIPILKARMNADLHMAGALKETNRANLFVIFGEPDIDAVSGQWLTTSSGAPAANCALVQELSGLGTLEAINEAGHDGLARLCEGSAGGARRSGRMDAPGGGGVPADGAASGDAAARAQRLAADAGGERWTDAQLEAGRAAVEKLTAADFPLALTSEPWMQVTVKGVDVFDPASGEVRSNDTDEIACWFIDTDYDSESFFVRQAYFLGANDPYKALKTTLKSEIDREAWESLRSAVSQPFQRPASGRIAVKVINHLGDEVMKVFGV